MSRTMMEMLSVILGVAILVSSNAKVDEKQSDGIVSDEEHHSKNEGTEHTTQYDHDAFLGKDEASTYKDLTPEESKSKLGLVFNKVDTDNDGQVTVDELQKWMLTAQNRYAKEDAEENLKAYDKNNDGKVSWDEYKNDAYGFLDENGGLKKVFDPDLYPKYQKDENKKGFYQKQVARDERRYKVADDDSDGILNLDELTAFLHPETCNRMAGITVKEAIEDMDKDDDNHVSMDEYIADLSSEQFKEGKEPKWITEEKKNFTLIHDKNKDGKLDEQEMRDWMFPLEDDQLLIETKHLIKEADTNGDEKISKDEMLKKSDVFVASQATDYGDLLRDEL